MSFNRPADNRPRNKPSHDGAHFPTDLQRLLTDLMSTRARYEALRISDGSFLHRAALLDRMHELRAELAQARRSSR